MPFFDKKNWNIRENKNLNNRIIIRGGKIHYELIDFLKGFSILTIAIMHLVQMKELAIPNAINKAASFGGTGVHIFFLCSGFGLYLSNKKHNLSWIKFLKRRVIKIYIPYIIIVLISAFLPFVYTDGDKLNALMSHILFYKMFVPKYESSFGGQMWYISTLFQFYLLFVPLCMLKSKLFNKKFGVICSGISVFWWIMTAALGISDIRIWGSFFLQYLWEFAVGMILADYLGNGKDIEIKTEWLILFAVVGTGLATFLKLKGGILTAFNDPLALLGYGSIAILIYMLNVKIIYKVIGFISSISYEWYLVHVLVYISAFRLFPTESLEKYIVAFAAFGGSIAVAVFYKKVSGKMIDFLSDFGAKNG